MMAIEKDMDQRAGPSIPLCDYSPYYFILFYVHVLRSIFLFSLCLYFTPCLHLFMHLLVNYNFLCHAFFVIAMFVCAFSKDHNGSKCLHFLCHSDILMYCVIILLYYKNENKLIIKCSADYFHILHIVERIAFV